MPDVESEGLRQVYDERLGSRPLVTPERQQTDNAAATATKCWNQLLRLNLVPLTARGTAMPCSFPSVLIHIHRALWMWPAIIRTVRRGAPGTVAPIALWVSSRRGRRWTRFVGSPRGKQHFLLIKCRFHHTTSKNDQADAARLS